jgi:hypothetical protein
LRCCRGTRPGVPGMRRVAAVRLLACGPVAWRLVVAAVHRGVFFFISLEGIVMRKERNLP